VTQELGERLADLPACIVLGGDPQAGAGYLPAERAPLVLDRIENPTEDFGDAPFVDAARRARRQELLESFEKKFSSDYAEDARVDARKRAYERAAKMLTSPALKAFDVTKEPDEVRKAYGDTDYGRALLVGRRLLQAGVRFVEVQLGGWDTHADNFNRVRRQLEILDPAWSALMDDLRRLRMLDETLVVWMGEFGRTPAVNAGNGRDHFTRAWSVALGGGGIAGGRVVGTTDALGMEVKERPVPVADLFATIARSFGIDPEKKYMAGKRPMKIVDEGKPVKELF